MWNFRDPAASIEIFRAAQKDASPDDQKILETQIARAQGLQGDFDGARQALDAIDRNGASPEVNVRYHLEYGRSICSPAHKPETQTDEAKERARDQYDTALELGREAGLDYLVIDILHMMTMVDTAPEDQLEWDLAAIEFMEHSEQPDAKRWAGSLYNNTGYALALLKRHEEAHEILTKSLLFREETGNIVGARIAHYMIAWNQRLSGDLQSALATQLRLEQEWDAAGEPDGYTFRELGDIYEALGETEKSEHYKAKAAATLGS